MASPILLFDQEIRLRTTLDGHRLIPGSEGPLGLPIEVFLRLYAVDPEGNPKLVKHLADILALVREIRSADEAVEIVCLPTAPETHFMFPGNQHVDVRVAAAPGRVGDLTAAAAQAAGHQSVKCAPHGNGFEIARDLVLLRPDGGCQLVRRIEHITRRGEYRLVEETPLGNIDRSEIILPDYE